MDDVEATLEPETPAGGFDPIRSEGSAICSREVLDLLPRKGHDPSTTPLLVTSAPAILTQPPGQPDESALYEPGTPSAICQLV